MRQGFFLYKILNAVIVAVLVLLYWSSDLIERDVKSLKTGLDGLREDVRELIKTVSKNKCSNTASSGKQIVAPLQKEIVGDPLRPNLLIADPYLEKTLPNMLGEDFSTSGSLSFAFVGRPDNLNPFNGFARVCSLYDICVPGLISPHIGKFEEFAPELAVKIEEIIVEDGTGDKEFRIYLRKGVYWSPLNPKHFPKSFNLDEHFCRPHLVTAHDFKFFYDVVMNPYVSEMRAVALRKDFENIVDFSVVDDHTFTVRWRAQEVIGSDGLPVKKVRYSVLMDTFCIKPLPRFVYQYFPDGKKIVETDDDPLTYQNNSVWAQNFASHWAGNYIVSIGPYIFNGQDDHTLSLVRNPDHYQPLKCLVDKVSVVMKDSIDGIFNDFKTGRLDFCFLAPNHMDNLDAFMQSEAYRTQAAQGMAVKEVIGADNAYSYLGWNMQSVFFESKKVRQAMNMLVDKDRIIEQIFNGRAFSVTGPFSVFSPSYNNQVEGWVFSPEEAERLLEEEGWVDSDGDGIREKEIDGVKVPFRFTVCYYVQSSNTKHLAELISMSLKSAGIDCRLMGLSLADLSKRFEEKNFDALIMGWCLGSPPEDPRSLWHSEGAYQKGSGNVVGFNNAEADDLIEKLTYEEDRRERRSLYHRLHELIHEEAPYLFLFSRKTTVLYREYVRNIFVPKFRTDLIPGAEDQEVNFSIVWIDKGESRDEIC